MRIKIAKLLICLMIPAYVIAMKPKPQPTDPFTILPTELAVMIISYLNQATTLDGAITSIHNLSQTSSQWRELLSDTRLTESIIKKLQATFSGQTFEEIARKLNTKGAMKLLVERGCIPYLQLIVGCITNTTDHQQIITLGNNKKITIPAKSVDKPSTVCINETIYKKIGTCGSSTIQIVTSPDTGKISFNLSLPIKEKLGIIIRPEVTGLAKFIIMEPIKPNFQDQITFTINLTISEETTGTLFWKQTTTHITSEVTKQVLKAPIIIKEKYP